MSSKRFTLTAGVGAVALGLFLGVAAAAQQVQITINGSPVSVEPPPTMQAGRVFVPLRGVFESLGATVVYSNGQINATGNGRDISLHIGSREASVNGEPQTIDVAPFIIGASTYVPLRFVSQALGAGVQWDESSQTVAITMAGANPQQAAYDNGGGYDENADYSDYDVDQAPPPIPDYEQPPAPDPNEVWMPGYWAWGPGGYYWVPGTWVPAPQPGLLWTPGYWDAQNGYYAWHQGYWAPTVGFYGGINYGGGYFGHGYAGGRWQGNTFRYNTAVTRVSPSIHNTYVDRSAATQPHGGRASYHGGRGGTTAQPTTAERAVANERHVPMTTQQRQHVQVASQDRHLLATANGGKPSVVAAPHPYSASKRPPNFTPVTAQDKAAAQRIAHPANGATRTTTGTTTTGATRTTIGTTAPRTTTPRTTTRTTTGTTNARTATAAPAAGPRSATSARRPQPVTRTTTPVRGAAATAAPPTRTMPHPASENAAPMRTAAPRSNATAATPRPAPVERPTMQPQMMRSQMQRTGPVVRPTPVPAEQQPAAAQRAPASREVTPSRTAAPRPIPTHAASESRPREEASPHPERTAPPRG